MHFFFHFIFPLFLPKELTRSAYLLALYASTMMHFLDRYRTFDEAHNPIGGKCDVCDASKTTLLLKPILSDNNPPNLSLSPTH